MANSSHIFKTLPTILLLILLLKQTSSAATVVKTKVFLSPGIVLEPGLVSNKNYYDIDFPNGHIALKGFTAELVDGAGNPVPLHETYLHHWVLQRYYARKDAGDEGLRRPSGYTAVRNSGVCDSGLTYYYGVGAETRRTSTDIRDPYGIEVGDPASIPAGYREGWMLNIHAIDTRGAEDVMGCSECRCDLYNVTALALPAGYKGGLICCPDDKKCRLKEGLHGQKRSLFLRYTAKYVDWDPSSIVAVNIYVLDVTDVWTPADESKGIKATHHCGVEYDVESCGVGVDKNECIDSKSMSVSFPRGGDLVYGVGHQHAGATAITLYGEGGRTICSSSPRYGEGNEAGNEAGFIVGMSTCYPPPAGPVKISASETLTLVSNYSSVESHSGVMALFYLLLADSPPKPTLGYEITRVPSFVWGSFLFGVVLVVVGILAWKGKTGKAEGYEAIP